MFTGIIEYAGEITRLERSETGARLHVRAEALAAEATLGASIAVNGVCLTVVGAEDGQLFFDAVPETLRRTSLGDLAVGDRVNLERPMPANGRFDGHIIQGHVDATGTLESVTEEGNSRRLRFRVEPELLRYVVEKGSITIDGISLTVAGLGPDWFEVAIIPHTWQVTNLGARSPGERVNLEVDILAKYVERLLSARQVERPNPTPPG